MRRFVCIVGLSVGCAGGPAASPVAPAGPAPTRVPDDPRTPAHIASGDYHSCLVRAGGSVECWGRNHEGQLGDGTTEVRTAPVAVAGLSGVVRVALGANSSCALLADRSVQC
ncbi:MAG TPA: hypothetical protein VKU41_01340, partial [Polyangiaceae bacterium]|nr:hypothetical protein [Polyangiaceae bacterium]